MSAEGKGQGRKSGEKKTYLESSSKMLIILQQLCNIYQHAWGTSDLDRRVWGAEKPKEITCPESSSLLVDLYHVGFLHVLHLSSLAFVLCSQFFFLSARPGFLLATWKLEFRHLLFSFRFCDPGKKVTSGPSDAHDDETGHFSKLLFPRVRETSLSGFLRYLIFDLSWPLFRFSFLLSNEVLISFNFRPWDTFSGV